MAVEPWPGYADLSEKRRKALMEFKIDEARLRWDMLYAQAIAAAVANYETLERADGAQPGEVETAAEEYVEKIKQAVTAVSGGEAGSWGHG